VQSSGACVVVVEVEVVVDVVVDVEVVVVVVGSSVVVVVVEDVVVVVVPAQGYPPTPLSVTVTPGITVILKSSGQLHK